MLIPATCCRQISCVKHMKKLVSVICSISHLGESQQTILTNERSITLFRCLVVVSHINKHVILMQYIFRNHHGLPLFTSEKIIEEENLHSTFSNIRRLKIHASHTKCLRKNYVIMHLLLIPGVNIILQGMSIRDLNLKQATTRMCT